MYRHRNRIAFSCSMLGMLWAASPAVAAHAYVSVCCTVPTTVSVISRTTHAVTGTLVAGGGAAFVVLTPDGQTAYVANETIPAISVLDTATGAQSSSISLAPYNVSPYAAVLSPDGGTLYVTATLDGFISLLAFHTGTGALIFNVPIPGVPGGYTSPMHLPAPAISADGGTLYIAGYEFVIFDVATQSVAATIATPPGYLGPEGLAVTPDGAYAVVTTNAVVNGNGQLTLVNLQTQAVVKQLDFGRDGFIGPAVSSPAGALVYFILNQSSSHTVAVQAFDITTQQVAKTFAAGSGFGQAIAITPDGAEIEVGNSYNATVTAIHAASGALSPSVATLGKLVSVTVSADGQSLYVPNFNSSMVAVVDPATSAISNWIPAGQLDTLYPDSNALKVSADGTHLVVSGPVNLTVIDAVHQQLQGVVAMPGPSLDVAVSANGDAAYALISAPNGGTAQIVAVDAAALKLGNTAHLATADRPADMAISPSGGALYVTDENCPTPQTCAQQVLVIDTATLHVTSRIPLSSAAFIPGEIVVTANGATAYVSNAISPEKGVISVVDLAQKELTGTISLPSNAKAIALAADQKSLFVLDGFATAGGLSAQGLVIDLQSQTVTAALPGDLEYPGQIAVGPSDQLVYVTSSNTYEIEAIRLPSNGPATRSVISLPGASGGVGFTIQ